MKAAAWFFVASLSAAVPGRTPADGTPTGLVTIASGRAIARYEPSPAPMKPYVKELFSPSGVQVTCDSPPDHFHHHGLMFAIGANEVDFWTEKPFERFGRQKPRAMDTRVLADGLAQTIDWVGSNGVPVLVERRAIRAAPPKAGGPNVLTWATTIEPAGPDAARLWGRHYFGLGIRFPADMNGKGEFVVPRDTPPGRVVRGDEILRPAAWCAATGEIGGRRVTVAMWDHPRNARRALWFTMSKPFSYLSATLDLEANPLAVQPGGTLALRYGIAVFDGPADAVAIEEARRLWIDEETDGTMKETTP